MTTAAEWEAWLRAEGYASRIGDTNTRAMAVAMAEEGHRIPAELERHLVHEQARAGALRAQLEREVVA